MKLKTDTYIDLHQQALTVLKQIKRIQKDLAYARLRAASDSKNWILKDWVPAWERDIVKLEKAYETRCAQYAGIQLLLVDEVKAEVVSHCVTQAPVYYPNRLKTSDNYRECPIGVL